MTNENEYIHRFADEAEVKRAETERIIQLKKMEAVEKAEEIQVEQKNVKMKYASKKRGNIKDENIE